MRASGLFTASRVAGVLVFALGALGLSPGAWAASTLRGLLCDMDGGGSYWISKPVEVSASFRAKVDKEVLSSAAEALKQKSDAGRFSEASLFLNDLTRVLGYDSVSDSGDGAVLAQSIKAMAHNILFVTQADVQERYANYRSLRSSLGIFDRETQVRLRGGINALAENQIAVDPLSLYRNRQPTWDIYSLLLLAYDPEASDDSNVGQHPEDRLRQMTGGVSGRDTLEWAVLTLQLMNLISSGKPAQKPRPSPSEEVGTDPGAKAEEACAESGCQRILGPNARELMSDALTVIAKLATTEKDKRETVSAAVRVDERVLWNSFSMFCNEFTRFLANCPDAKTTLKEVLAKSTCGQLEEQPADPTITPDEWVGVTAADYGYDISSGPGSAESLVSGCVEQAGIQPQESGAYPGYPSYASEAPTTSELPPIPAGSTPNPALVKLENLLSGKVLTAMDCVKDATEKLPLPSRLNAMASLKARTSPGCYESLNQGEDIELDEKTFARAKDAMRRRDERALAHTVGLVESYASSTVENVEDSIKMGVSVARDLAAGSLKLSPERTQELGSLVARKLLQTIESIPDNELSRAKWHSFYSGVSLSEVGQSMYQLVSAGLLDPKEYFGRVEKLSSPMARLLLLGDMRQGVSSPGRPPINGMVGTGGGLFTGGGGPGGGMSGQVPRSGGMGGMGGGPYGGNGSR